MVKRYTTLHCSMKQTPGKEGGESQQSLSLVQGAPTERQDVVAGTEPHDPAQHSLVTVQAPPGLTQIGVGGGGWVCATPVCPGNTQFCLRDESHLHRLRLPVAGIGTCLAGSRPDRRDR